MISRLKEKHIELFLTVAAFSLIILLFLKAIIDADMSYDTWAYHLPFASRLWGITTPDTYLFQDRVENLYRGFPLLGEYLQGFFWYTFKRPEAANLVSWFSLITFLFFLKAYFKIPFYLSALALLAVPLVQIHATSCYVDLPANIALSILILLTYLLYTRNDFLSIKNLFFIFLSAACSANMKLQLIPIVLFVLFFTGVKIFLLMWFKGNHNEIAPIKVSYLIIILLFAVPITFATPIKNLITHQNPAYPVKLKIYNIVLNGEEEPYSSAPPTLINDLPSVRWIYSIFEIGLPPYSSPRRWTIGQWAPPESTSHRMGGFFGLYVIFHLGILIYLLLRVRSLETKIGGLMLILLSLLASVMPQSHELRYYIFWIISLISLNLYIISTLPPVIKGFNLINKHSTGIACLIALFIVACVTNIEHFRPKFNSVDKLIAAKTKDDIVKSIDVGSAVCIVSDIKTAQWTFLYAPIFHQRKIYSVKVASSIDECGTYTVILDY